MDGFSTHGRRVHWVNCRSAPWARAFTSTAPAGSKFQAAACRHPNRKKCFLPVFLFFATESTSDKKHVLLTRCRNDKRRVFFQMCFKEWQNQIEDTEARRAFWRYCVTFYKRQSSACITFRTWNIANKLLRKFKNIFKKFAPPNLQQFTLSIVMKKVRFCLVAVDKTKVCKHPRLHWGGKVAYKLSNVVMAMKQHCQFVSVVSFWGVAQKQKRR